MFLFDIFVFLSFVLGNGRSVGLGFSLVSGVIYGVKVKFSFLLDG